MTNPRPIPVPRAAVGQLGGYALTDLKAPAVPVPSKNKAIELGNNLNKFFGVATQYVSLAEEQFNLQQKQLARRSPEEIEEGLKKTESEIDRQTIKGFIPWFTSPLNKERNLRAEGKLASSGLINEIEARMINPKPDDPKDLTAIANLVRQEYIESKPLLQSSTLAQEGLNEATTSRIQALVSNYGRQRAVFAKADTSSQAMDTIYNLVNEHYDGSTVSGFKEDMLDADGIPISITNLLKSQWDELGAFSPREQEALLETTLQALSRDGNEVKADAFLDWASANLKIGNAKMSVVLKSRLSQTIDDSAKRFEQAKDKQTNDLVISQLGDYKAAHNAIQAGRVGVYNGKEYTDTTQLQLAAENRVNYPAELDLDKRGFTQLTDEINNFVRADVDPVERMKDELKRDTVGLQAIISDFYKNRIKPVFDDAEKLVQDGKAQQLFLNANIELQQSIDAEESRLVLSGLPIEKQKQNLIQFAQQESNRIFNEFKKALSDRSVEFDKEAVDKERVERFLTDSTEGNTKAVEKNALRVFAEKYDVNFQKDYDYQVTVQNLKVLGNKQALAEEKEKAINLVRSEGVRDSVLLAEKLQPNAWKEEPSIFFPRVVERNFLGLPSKVTTKGLRYSEEELKTFRTQLININSFLETFTNEEVLETGVLVVQNSTVRFDPKLFAPRTRIARILTVSEMEEAKDIKTGADMPDSIKRKARFIGVDDLVQFVKDQREFAQRLRLIK